MRMLRNILYIYIYIYIYGIYIFHPLLKKACTLIIAYIEVLLPLYRDADWFFRCACFVSDCYILTVVCREVNSVIVTA